MDNISSSRHNFAARSEMRQQAKKEALIAEREAKKSLESLGIQSSPSWAAQAQSRDVAFFEGLSPTEKRVELRFQELRKRSRSSENLSREDDAWYDAESLRRAQLSDQWAEEMQAPESDRPNVTPQKSNTQRLAELN
jgi:hypothetical protein